MNGKTVYLVRHGQSDYNLAGRIQGCSNESVLTDKGGRTAKKLGKWLQTVHLDTVLASPLNRVIQTADLLLQNHPTPPKLLLDPDLREVDVPLWQGMKHDDIKSTEPDLFHRWMSSPHTLEMRLPGGSHFPAMDLYKRAQSVWSRVDSMVDARVLLIVSHGGTIQAMINLAMGLGPDRHHTLQQSNCGLTMIDIAAESASKTIGFMNETSHIGERAPKMKAGERGLRVILVPWEARVSSEMIRRIRESLDNLAILIEIGLTHDDELVVRDPKRETPDWSNISGDTPVDLFDRTEQPGNWIRQSGRETGKDLTNLLVLSSTESFAGLVSDITGIGEAASSCIRPEAGSSSIVHFSNDHPRPIIQSLNTRHFAALLENS